VSVAAAVEAAKRAGDFASLVEAIPYLQFLGVRVEVRDGRRIGVMPFADHLVGNPTVPALHGGTLGALLESMAHLELLATTDHGRLPRTITLTIDYLRSGKTRDVFAAAKVVKSGRRVATLQCHAWQEDENAPIATAMVILKVS
jgi:uncharacterized protein (TIGR00369 family)